MKEDNTFENNLIRIGQNAEENHFIIKNSNQNDIWFHLDKLPSCHVIISSNNQEITKNMIYYCADLVKNNTKYKNFKNVKVIYTEIKNIKCNDVKGAVIIKGKTKIINV
jgi:predicted ribosome quality control (RQC) complex YloA/Tae2 family protein